MGSNMMRQAVPLIRSESPYVCTGLERRVALDSRVMVSATEPGKVTYVSATKIIVTPDGKLPKRGAKDRCATQVYDLRKFMRSNAGTCMNQKSIVKQGQRVSRGMVLADGPNTDGGELAIGRNVLVAFMPWGGYNFEDSILISERVVKDDSYTSIHIEEFECTARDTKLGKEDITRDIPNVGEEALADLDESGIIRIGAEVKSGGILVGKVTPKGETQLSPEERLLRAIFGEKAGDVKDTSMRVPPGVTGIVIDAKVFSRAGVEKDERTLAIEAGEISRLKKDLQDEKDVIVESAKEMLVVLLEGEKLKSDLYSKETNEVLLRANKAIEIDHIEEFPFVYLVGGVISGYLWMSL